MSEKKCGVRILDVRPIDDEIVKDVLGEEYKKPDFIQASGGVKI